MFLVSLEPDSFAGVEHILRNRHLKVCKCASAQAFFAHQPTDTSGVVVAEVRRPELVGMELLQQLAEREINLPVIIVADDGGVPTAVQSIRAGAVEFLEEPVSPRDLVRCIRQSLDSYR